MPRTQPPARRIAASIPPRRRRFTGASAAALAVALLVPVDVAEAASIVRDALLGDEVEDDLEAGDVHVYRVPLTAGTALDVEVQGDDDSAPKRSDHDDDDDDDPVGGAPLTLVLRAPDGSEFRRGTGTRVRLAATVPTSGTWTFELTSAAATEYEMELDGRPGRGADGGRTTVAVAGGTSTLHLDVPRGAFVRIEVRRRRGGRPVVADVRDGLGRSLAVAPKRASASRVVLRSVPVTAVGGLDVDVGAVGGGAGTYVVRTEIESLSDDGPAGTDDDDREDREIILTLAPGADPLAVVAALGPGYELEDVFDGFIVVETPEGHEGTEDDDAVDADVRSDDVLGGEVNWVLQTPEGSQSNALIVGSDLGRAAFDAQPAFTDLRADGAHLRATGTGVVVAVLDTGAAAAHPLLAGRTLPGFDFVDDDADPSEVANGVDEDLDGIADEGFGHGTFVAGLVLGTAPDARILPVRVLDSEARGKVSDIAAGVLWAVENGADVINLSLEMPVRSLVLADAVRYALGRGVVVVAATGNGGLASGPSFPATVNGVVAVTSTDAAGRPVGFANGGRGTTIAAPGTDLVGPVPEDRWGTWSGTSFSSGFASGGVALLLERLPAMLPTQVVQRISNTARPAPQGLPAPRRRLLGAGRLDLARLLR